MKLTMEMHGTKFTIEEDRDSQDIYEMGEILEKALLAMGYHYDNVRELLGDDFEEECGYEDDNDFLNGSGVL